MNWVPGRQGGGYEKLELLSWRFFDLYLIRYREGAGVKWHVDPVKGKKHFRINVLLRKAKEGGDFFIRRKTGCVLGRVRMFRPDLSPHCVMPVVKGERLVLSLGWVKK